MTFGITPEGFVIKPLETIEQEVNDSQLANVDPGLDQDARSALGQVNLPHVGALAELWELAQAVYNAAYPDSANDDSLDNVSSITGTTRSPSTKTLVEGVEVTLNPNASLPAGSVAHLTNQPNARFVSLVTVPGTPGGGVFLVDFEAEADGATQVIAGQLDTIAEPVTGWSTVDNPNPGITGEETETDAELRTKRLDELEAQGSTNVNSIRADLLRVDAVVDAVVFENDTDVVDVPSGRPPHSIQAILRGGASSDIGQQIFDSKAAGIATFGAETESVLDTMGFSHDMNFDFASELVFFCAITVETDPLVFDVVQGPIDIKDNIAAYVNSLRIGGDVIYDIVKAAVLPIPNQPECGVAGVLKITVLLVGFSDPPLITTDLAVAATEFASSDIANIDVTVV